MITRDFKISVRAHSSVFELRKGRISSKVSVGATQCWERFPPKGSKCLMDSFFQRTHQSYCRKGFGAKFEGNREIIATTRPRMHSKNHSKLFWGPGLVLSQDPR